MFVDPNPHRQQQESVLCGCVCILLMPSHAVHSWGEQNTDDEPPFFLSLCPWRHSAKGDRLHRESTPTCPPLMHGNSSFPFLAHIADHEIIWMVLRLPDTGRSRLDWVISGLHFSICNVIWVITLPINQSCIF